MTEGSTGHPASPVDEHTQNDRSRGRQQGAARAPWGARAAEAPPQLPGSPLILLSHITAQGQKWPW